MRRLLRWTLALALPAPALVAAVSMMGNHYIERTWPPVGQFIDVDGHGLHYTGQGSGQPGVLIHGASSSLPEFQSSLAPALSQHFRVLAFDRPGQGYIERGNGGWPSPAHLVELLITASETIQRSVKEGTPTVSGASAARAFPARDLQEELLDLPQDGRAILRVLLDRTELPAYGSIGRH